MSNKYYTHTTYPTENSLASSAGLRAELDLITAGFTAVQSEVESKMDGGGAVQSAGKLTFARTIALTGDVTGSAVFDGSANIAIVTTLVGGSPGGGGDGPEIPEGGILMAHVNGLLAALDAKANTLHVHELEHINGLAGALGAKADSSHTHYPDDVTGLTAALNGKAALTHYHEPGEVNGLAATLNGLTSGLSGKANTSHSHSTSDITGLPAALNNKADVWHTHSGYADSGHTHSISNISNLQSALDGKANTSHTHSGYADSGHTHTSFSTLSITSTTNSTSASTGALKVSGGIGVGGNIYSSGNVTAYSDERLKTDVELIPFALDKVRQIRGVTYTRKDTGERQAGVIAQEVQKVLPEVVSGDDILGVAYGNLAGLLIEAIKEVADRVECLEAKQ